ncbi:GGDEF domain-containing protein [Amycolatopsis nigrescens]|uniref:GGDEF domain-containing protein n=1 Tax=Amycolatopsis nigrescens TaxID=381445 RepID=UPI000374EC07|nr:GGDEF domain-containing protein [Amycolatopsis nigrescens]
MRVGKGDHISAMAVRGVTAPRRWALWSQRPRVIGYLLVCTAAVLVTTAVLAPTTVIRSKDLVALGALVALGVLQVELGRQVERVRRRDFGTVHINMTSVWLFAGVLLLPPVLTAALTAALYLHLAVRVWRWLQRVPTFLSVSNAIILMLTCYASKAVFALCGFADLPSAVAAGRPGAVAVVAALATHFVVNAALVLPARERPGRTMRELFGDWTDNALEVATLCLGALYALVTDILPGLVLLVLPPLLVLHRSVLIRQLETAATVDGKTGLLNNPGWHALAEQTLLRARRQRITFGLLMIDLDFFKRVNDTYGHLAGDDVLRAVAATITAEVRPNDAVGRFGGEEFVVLLPDVTGDDITAVAERIRTAISELTIKVVVSGTTQLVDGLSASIGTAIYPLAGTGIQWLLDAADAACYQAKKSGRNRIVQTSELS